MTLITCEICGTSFEPDSPRQKICDNPECAKIRSRQYYLKWKEANPTKRKQYNHEQYLRRKKTGKHLVYVSKAMPKAKKYKCQRCGKKTVNRFNCPTCLNILMERISEEYTEYIFMDGNFEGINTTPTVYDQGRV